MVNTVNMSYFKTNFLKDPQKNSPTKSLLSTFLLILATLTLCLTTATIATPAHAYETRVIEANGLTFWTESFGKKQNPPMLLIMGSGGQGLLWPDEFCNELADKGFYVIRFDNRDTGLSSSIDYETTPYTLLDMANDCVGILDQYGIKSAHIVGASMGGEIAMLLGAHYPKRVKSLSLLMTTPDMSPIFDAMQGKEPTSTLSKPAAIIVESAKKFIEPPETFDDRVTAFMDSVRLHHGTAVPPDEKLCRQIAEQHIVRAKDPEGVKNHFLATQASYDLHKKAPSEIANAKFATMIIHGDHDPIFPIDHAHALKQAIKNSKLAIITGMGHGFLNTQFYKPIIDKITEIAKDK